MVQPLSKFKTKASFWKYTGSIAVTSILIAAVMYLAILYRNRTFRNPGIGDMQNVISATPSVSMYSNIISDASGKMTYKIPKGAFGEYKGTIEVDPGRHGHDFDSKYRFIMDSMIIAGTLRSPVDVVLQKPMSVSAIYDKNYLKHLDEDKVTFLFTKDSMGTSRYPWIELSTEVDKVKNTVTTSGAALGNYVLVAPLLCPSDTAEFDDNYDSSHLLDKSKMGMKIPMIFDIPGDQNWLKFFAQKDNSYKISIEDMAFGVKPVIEIYDSSGLNKISVVRDGETWTPSIRDFAQASKVLFFIRVVASSDSATGCHEKFNFVLNEI